jgi:hypothetical protein
MYKDGINNKNLLLDGTDSKKGYYNGTLVFDKNANSGDEYTYSKFRFVISNNTNNIEASVWGNSSTDIAFGIQIHPTIKNAIRFYLKGSEHSNTPSYTRTVYASEWIYASDKLHGWFGGGDLSYYHATKNLSSLRSGDRVIIQFIAMGSMLQMLRAKDDWSGGNFSDILGFIYETRSFYNGGLLRIQVDNSNGSRLRYEIGIEAINNGFRPFIQTIGGGDPDNFWNGSRVYSPDIIYFGRTSAGNLQYFGNVLLVSDTNPIVKNTGLHINVGMEDLAHSESGEITFDGNVFSGKLISWWFFDDVTNDLSIEATNKNGVSTFTAKIQGQTINNKPSYVQGVITHNNNTGFSGSIAIHFEYSNAYQDWIIESIAPASGKIRDLRVKYKWNGEGDWVIGERLRTGA